MTHHARKSPLLSLPLTLLLLLGTAACATTGATLGSGVGDRMLEHPPWYAGSVRVPAVTPSEVAVLPIAYQAGATQPPIFDPSAAPGRPLAALLTALDDSLRAMRVGTPISVGAGAPPNRVPPDVRFGCLTRDGMPGEECAARGDSVLGRRFQQMQLSVGRPSAAWTAWAREEARRVGARYLLVITVETGEYLLRQEGLRGSKVIELGTGDRTSLPWLTSLETPVRVLQLTGALVDSTGRAVRIGAEGIHAVRTRLTVSAIGGQELLRDDDVAEAATRRREELPGAPLASQVALRQLVQQLLGTAPANGR